MRHSFSRSLSDRSRLWLSYAAAFVAMLILWFAANAQYGISYPSLIGTLMKVCGDTALILLPFWLLPGKWRYYVLCPIWAFGIWNIVNVAYYRFWGDLLPGSVFMMTDNINTGLLNAAGTMWRASDIIFAAVPVLLTAAVAVIRPDKYPKISIRHKLIISAVSLLVFLAGQFSYVRSYVSWSRGFEDKPLKERVSNHFLGGFSSHLSLYSRTGVFWYAVRVSGEALSLLGNRMDLSDSQNREISDFLVSAGSAPADSTRNGGVLPADSTNIIFIIVESLNSDAVSLRIDGTPVMPTLDSLSRAVGTVYFPNVVPQIKEASSSDGHLILMTGLLPLKSGPYSLLYGSSGHYPSLAMRLKKHHKYLLMADNGEYWNEKGTLENFGLGDAVTLDRLKFDKRRYGRDGALMLHAAAMMDTVRKPFMLTMMTMSMHTPFDQSGWKMPDYISASRAFDDMQKKYLNVCHHTDYYISELLKRIPANTMVIICSDHTQHLAPLDPDRIPTAVFMAAGTRTTYTSDRVIGQVNIYPALLELLGIRGVYRGLDSSALSEEVSGTVDATGRVFGSPSAARVNALNKAFEISDMIIRGDYFRKADF